MVFESVEAPSEPLYSAIQRFFIKTNCSDEKHRDLRITVNFSNSRSKVSKQVLNVQVSDDEDPFFYYSLVLTEDDYQRLKQLQGLLVDFESFPSQVIRLLEQCKENDSNVSKFLLILEEDKNNGAGDNLKTSLKIVETNNFKHLCHLVLIIEPGNDSDIKKLMLLKIKNLKEQNQKAEKCINDLESQLFSKSKYLAAKEQELFEIKQKWKEDRLLFKAESSKELCEETEKLKKAQLEWQIKTQRERNELEEKYHTELKEKDSELSRLRLESQILQEKRAQLDSVITDQAKRIEKLEKELATCRADIISLRKQSSKLDSDYHEKEKLVNSLKTRLAVAEQESKDMAVFMKDQQERLNKLNEEKIQLSGIINDKDKIIQRKINKIQNLGEELAKANEIITKIQKEMAIVNQKLKVRTTIALEQEKVVESNQSRIKDLEKALHSQEKKIHSLMESEQSLKLSIAELNSSIEVKDKKIKDDERIIDWLNRRLLEQTKSSSPSSAPNGCHISGVTSTPFPRFRSQETPASGPLLFSAIRQSPPLDSVRSLDQLKNLQVEEGEKIPGNNSQSNSKTDDTEGSKQSITPKAADIGNKKPIVPKNVMKKTSFKTPGFKRSSLPEVQSTSVPSSYFLK